MRDVSRASPLRVNERVVPLTTDRPGRRTLAGGTGILDAARAPFVTSAQVPDMADPNHRETPDKPRDPAATHAPKPPHKHTEREELMRDPNLNQAENWHGSADQTQGSQTGNDIDLIPEPEGPP
jgi:hypothetical protein